MTKTEEILLSLDVPPNIIERKGLNGYPLNGKNLANVDLSGYDLKLAKLANTEITWATICNCQDKNLLYANLEGNNLTGADFTGYVVLGAKFPLLPYEAAITLTKAICFIESKEGDKWHITIDGKMYNNSQLIAYLKELAAKEIQKKRSGTTS